MARVRRGDKVPLTGIEELGNSRREIRELLDAWEDLNIQIVNRQSKRSVHAGDVGWIVRGVSKLDEKRRKIGAGANQPERMPEVDARPIWHDHRLEWEEAIARMPGWSRKTAYKYLGPRGVPVGRRPAK
jgi:hypothetical protein